MTDSAEEIGFMGLEIAAEVLPVLLDACGPDCDLRRYVITAGLALYAVEVIERLARERGAMEEMTREQWAKMVADMAIFMRKKCPVVSVEVPRGADPACTVHQSTMPKGPAS